MGAGVGGLRAASTGPFVRCTLTTTPPPCRGLRARFAVRACSSSKAVSEGYTRYYPPVLPTRITHPRPLQGPTASTDVDQHGARGTAR